MVLLNLGDPKNHGFPTKIDQVDQAGELLVTGVIVRNIANLGYSAFISPCPQIIAKDKSTKPPMQNSSSAKKRPKQMLVNHSD